LQPFKSSLFQQDMSNEKHLISEFNQQLKDKPAVEVLQFFILNYKARLGFSTSLGAEDQVITQMIAAIDPSVYMFTLDTGRLFPETYDLLDMTQKRYKVNIKVCFPDKKAVENMVNSKGINLFYESIENRKLCCNIRKIQPLKIALENVDFWISGLRREQSVTRENLSLVEWDELNGKIKINPLIDWNSGDMWDYIKQNNIPYNPLHDHGFPSLGCMPCTRAIEPGEDIRAGRWWWENPEMKECGLHK
jgi:phosphoadenosine phosphosulfate reductase